MIKKYLSPFILPIIIFLSVALFISFRNNKSTQTISQEAATEQSIKDSIIVRCFLKNIYADILSFYSNPDIEVFDYETEVLSVEDKKFVGTLVRFRSTPQIGAHNPIGEDELTYHIAPNGEITLTDYKHVKNYSLQ
ncbi:DUF3888 domain-containing protein [Clostridium sp. WB02_MRS01]|uniref:DUF3888 domain-containing protein n=1 Tax=Clostridium sp. WB02_MRS01 TaxID=2605777 RepID=UPI0012B39486|nr:DUF3888 domain-containing protein [Clostridium sp. WB02_MRS01]MSS11729.1 DUF3888 domain-containing protein [Clostridium sp. WB02_MRS01]